MSAFMHSQEHLRVIVWAGLQVQRHLGEDDLRWSAPDPATLDEVDRGGIHQSYGWTYRTLDHDTAQDVLRMLAKANRDSVTARYGQDDEMVEGWDEYTYGPGPQDRRWDWAEILQAVHSFEYQACEVEDWEASEAFKFARALEGRIVRRQMGRDLQTAWSIDEGDQSKATDREAQIRSIRQAESSKKLA